MCTKRQAKRAKGIICKGILMMLSILNIIHWMEEHMLACPSKKYLHIDCPGCGFQRSVISLFKGDIAASVKMYPATLPLLFIFCFTILHLIFKFKNGGLIIKYAAIFTGVIIIASYIYKIINQHIA